MNELEALTILTRAPYLGSIKIRLLIHHFGSALNVLNADAAEIMELPGFGQKIAQYWKFWETSDKWIDDLELAKRLQVQFIPYTSPQYPKKLFDLTDFPLILYLKGDLKATDQRSIAVVGTRQSSVYGNTYAEKISEELAELGYTVVSGLARGIDTAAHQGALKKGRTIAVIGSGLADIYPPENRLLANQIVEHGALISEFPMTTPPDRQNFPQRNRIVAAMTMGSVLIEAPEKSGAMLTMERAKSLDRKTFALPGRADAENFKGNLQLLKSKETLLVESGKDIAGHFEELFQFCPPSRPNIQYVHSLEGEEKTFFQQLPTEEFDIDTIAKMVKLPVAKLNVLLMSLVLKKMIKEFPGKIFRKISV